MESLPLSQERDPNEVTPAWGSGGLACSAALTFYPSPALGSLAAPQTPVPGIMWPSQFPPPLVSGMLGHSLKPNATVNMLRHTPCARECGFLESRNSRRPENGIARYGGISILNVNSYCQNSFSCSTLCTSLFWGQFHKKSGIQHCVLASELRLQKCYNSLLGTSAAGTTPPSTLHDLILLIHTCDPLRQVLSSLPECQCQRRGLDRAWAAMKEPTQDSKSVSAALPLLFRVLGKQDPTGSKFT